MPGFNINISDECSNKNSTAGYTGPYPNVETARQHRFRFTVLDPVKDILLYAYQATRPVVEIDKMTMHRGFDEIYLPGKRRWSPIEITFYEVVLGNTTSTSPDKYAQTANLNTTAELLYKWHSGSASNPNIGLININNSRLTGNAAKIRYQCQFEMLNGAGQPIWKYKLHGCWPSKVSPSAINYSSNEISEIAVTIEYNKAEEIDPTMEKK